MDIGLDVLNIRKRDDNPQWVKMEHATELANKINDSSSKFLVSQLRGIFL